MQPQDAKTQYCVSYYHNGSWWGLRLYAVDWADAEAICSKLSMRLDGEFVCEIPERFVRWPWLANLICRVCNLFNPTSGRA